MISEAVSKPKPPSLTVQAGWLLAARTIGFALTFVVPLLIVRVLSQNDFGLYKQVFLLIGTATPLISLGFHMNVFYFLPRQPEKGGKIVMNILFVNFVCGLAAFFVLWLFPGILGRLFDSTGLVPYGALIGALLLAWISGFFLELVATANQDVAYSSAFIVLSQFTKAILMATAALAFKTLAAVLYAALAQSLFQNVVLLWYLQKRFSGFWRLPDWALMREQIHYAVPLGVASLAVMLQNDLHMYFVANRFSPAEYAIYAVGCLQLPLIGLLRDSVNSVVLPRVTFLQQQPGGGRQIAMLLASAMRKLSAVYWPIIGYLLVAGYEFLILLFTPRYAASWPVFVVNLFLIPVTMLMTDPVMRAYKEHMPFLLKVRFACTALLVVAIHFGIVLFGMPGALAATATIMLLERLVLTRRMVGVLGVSRRDLGLLADVGKLAIAAAIAAIATAAFRSVLPKAHPIVILAATGVVYCAIYAASVLLLKIPQPDEIALVRGGILKVRSTLKLA
jgi:O-antigen/teichoic acid export membrane protein